MSIFQNFRRQWIKFTIFMVIIIFIILIYSNYEKELIPRLNEQYYAHIFNNYHIEGTPANTIYCYKEKMESLPDISDTSPRLGKSIFFHETSCRSFQRGKITVTSRQACAVESAAKLNPDLDVYLLFSSPGVFNFKSDESDNFLESLLTYKNVKIMHLNFGRYTKDTPVENLYKSGKIENSKYVVSHSSDVLSFIPDIISSLEHRNLSLRDSISIVETFFAKCNNIPGKVGGQVWNKLDVTVAKNEGFKYLTPVKRFVTLWKYGGIYLDLDTISIKSIQNLSLNFVGLESFDTIGSAVLSFASNGIGHTLATNCLNDQKNRFDGENWATNGPGVITRTLQTHCNVRTVTEILNKTCEGITVYPEIKFFAVPYPGWKMFFQAEYLEEVKKATKQSYLVHIWNKLSGNEKISLNSLNVPYLHFAKKYCPKVLKACNNFF